MVFEEKRQAILSFGSNSQDEPSLGYAFTIRKKMSPLSDRMPERKILICPCSGHLWLPEFPILRIFMAARYTM